MAANKHTKAKAAVKPVAGKYAKKGSRKRDKPTLSPLVIEVISILTLAFSFLLILSLYTPDGAGAIGNFLRGFLKGLFGFGAYLLPIAIIFISVYMLMTENKSFSKMQVILGASFFIVIISFIYVFNMDASLKYDGVIDFIASSYGGGDYNNGGLLGALFGSLLNAALGKVGTYIILTAAATGVFILLSGYSLVDLLRKTGNDIKDASRTERRLDVYEEPDKPKYIRKKEPSPAYEPKKNPKNMKKLNYVINDDDKIIDDEEEIHIITESKKFAKSGAERKIDGFSITRPPSFDRNIKSEHAFEKSIETVNEIFGGDINYLKKIENDEISESKRGKEVYVPPKLNFDVILDDDDYYVENQDYNNGEINKRNPLDGISSQPMEYEFPPIESLKQNPNPSSVTTKSQVFENSKKLEETLKSFGVEAKVVEVNMGPTVTRYELSPGHGVKVSKILALADDLALSLAAVGIRIEAPIPGKAAVGLEVPNKEVQPVFLREVIESGDFGKYPSNLAFALGKDIAGNTIVTDISKMPHLLIAGATGSGKSVCINTLVTSIIYKSSPDEVKLLMIDPKVVELSVYNGIPHLLIPVVTDAKKAAGALNWAVKEMISRYNLFAETSVRDLKGYNSYLADRDEAPLPQIVIIVDELADLMMVSKSEVEDAICRLAQMARAAGLHLVIATQRPSVDVITGLIKANIPSRIAFSVTSGTDSRTILDMTGAEKLLGKGDMLFSPVGQNKPVRVQGAFISDKEVESIVNFLKKGGNCAYSDEMIDKITSAEIDGDTDGVSDKLFFEAMDFLVQKEKISVSMLQRNLRITYKMAVRLMKEIEARGFIEPENGAKSRKTLMSPVEWEVYKERNSL